MTAASVIIAGELARTASTAGRLVKLVLEPVADGVNRSRGSARFTAALLLDGRADLGAVTITDTRGYPVAWTVADAARWASLYLSGASCALAIEVTDAAKLPARWTPARLASHARKLAAIDPAAMRAEAADKRATVQDWADGPRRAAVLAASGRMDGAAALLEALRDGAPPPAPPPAPTPAPTPAPPPAPTPAPPQGATEPAFVGGALVQSAYAPAEADAYAIAAPVRVEHAGTGASLRGWCFLPQCLALRGTADDAAARAWFASLDAGQLAAPSVAINEDDTATACAALFSLRSGQCLAVWRAGYGVDLAPGLAPIGILYATGGTLRGADRGDGDAGAQAAARAGLWRAWITAQGQEHAGTRRTVGQGVTAVTVNAGQGDEWFNRGTV